MPRDHSTTTWKHMPRKRDPEPFGFMQWVTMGLTILLFLWLAQMGLSFALEYAHLSVGAE